jgi:hypothetical protein
VKSSCRQYYWSDPKRARKRVRNYYAEHRAERSEYGKRWHEQNREANNARSRAYHAKHRKRRSLERKRKRAASDEVRAWARAYNKAKRLSDPNYRTIKVVTATLRRAIRHPTRPGSAPRHLGCSIEFFKEYIAAKFKKPMSWRNWGRVWQLDHIKPFRSFDLTDQEQLLQACHYTNVQPLFIAEHFAKTSKEKTRHVA